MSKGKTERYKAPACEPQHSCASDDVDFHITPELQILADAVWDKAQREWQIPAGSSVVECPLQVFFQVLKKHYGNNLRTFISGAKTIGENARFSDAVASVFGERDWSMATVRKYATELKRILNLLDIPQGFVASLRLAPVAQTRPLRNVALGKYTALPVDDPVRQRLESWICALRDGTRNRSPIGIRNIIIFYCNICLPALRLDLRNWPDDLPHFLSVALPSGIDCELLKSIVGETRHATLKTIRLRFLIHEIFGASEIFIANPRRNVQTPEEADDDGSDPHRISSKDLELIHAKSQQHPLDELVFMVLITTGLRLGGLTATLISNVAQVKSGQYEILSQGKTKEKGDKFARFVISPQVKPLLLEWLTVHRAADKGPYVFPGAIPGRHITTDALRTRFRRLCERCGLEGQQFHPHALRHSHAHILLECGNSVEAVSKCLNHSNTSVTEKFYLRESAAEVQSRCNVPWMQKETESEKKTRVEESLPSFLKPSDGDAEKRPSARSYDTGKRLRREAKDELLKNFMQSA